MFNIIYASLYFIILISLGQSYRIKSLEQPIFTESITSDHTYFLPTHPNSKYLFFERSISPDFNTILKSKPNSSLIMPVNYQSNGSHSSNIYRYNNNHDNPPNSYTSSQSPSPKRIFVLGGDGFCGWPTSLHLSSKGHEIIILDNLSRRAIDESLGTASLTPISSLETRVTTWNSLQDGKLIPIKYHIIDIAKQYHEFLSLIKSYQPDTIIHFAEQRSAPYSMKSTSQKRYTVENNIAATNNVLCAILDSKLDIHVVHLGTMGVYGYSTSGSPIPEGYLNVKLDDGQEKEILHPAYPGSVYHTTKCLDALLFQFYHQNDKIRITDLHQGIVWGTNTPQTRMDERLINRFDYDSDYGTVLNRFIMQSALNIPLTVYGIGGQTRAFINIEDTCKCIELAVQQPPSEPNRVEILNQVAETLKVSDIAQIICEYSNSTISNIPNPRNEAQANDLVVENNKFKSLGWEPIKFHTGLVKEVKEVAQKYTSRVDMKKIAPSSFWNKAREEASSLSKSE